MKQVVQDLRSKRPTVLEVPVPQPGPGSVLVRTQASLISAGTERAVAEFAGKSPLAKARARPDLVRRVLEKARQEGPLSAVTAVRQRLDQPIALGYSSAGRVEAIGEGVTALRVGDRVACAGRGAGHAEFGVVPAVLTARLPDSVDYESGAFTTLGAIAMHGFRLAAPQLGERVAVIGLGLLGQLVLQIVRAGGCIPFGVDLQPARVNLAEQLGAEAAARGEAEARGAALSAGRGFDAVLICAHTTDADPLELAGRLARDRARIVVIGAVGMQVPRDLYYDKELSLTVSRSYGPGRYDPSYEEHGVDYPIGYVRWTEQRNLEAFVELLAQEKVQVKPLVTHRFPVEQAEQAYETLSGGSGEAALGVMLIYPETVSPARRIQVSSQPAAGTATVRLGVLGAGNFATGVAFPILRRLKGVELVGLASTGGLSGAQAGRRYGFQYVTTSPEELAADGRINTLAVLTRHHLHAAQAAHALAAGNHVFCEKPLAIDERGLDQVLEALEAAPGLLTVGFNRRFSPLGMRMQGFLRSAGEPLSIHYRVNAGFLPAGAWQHDPAQGGGRIIGEVCHFVDFLVYLLGTTPTRIQTSGLPNADRYIDDNVHLSLAFSDGSLATVDYLASGDRAYPKERIEAFGGGRVAVLDDFRRLELVSAGRRKVFRSRLRQDKGHRGIWESFVEAIQSGGPPPIPYGQIAAVTRTTFRAVESLRTGRTIELEPVWDGGE
jgi:predicted dehydrogenase